MKKPNLDPQERELIASYERGEWTSIDNQVEGKRRLIDVAQTTLRKDSRVNIRISTKDLEAIRAKAFEEGIPYQTLIASILHKYLSGRLVERS